MSNKINYQFTAKELANILLGLEIKRVIFDEFESENGNQFIEKIKQYRLELFRLERELIESDEVKNIHEMEYNSLTTSIYQAIEIVKSEQELLNDL